MAIATDAPRLDAALALVKQLEEELPQASQPFQLVICDASGKKVAHMLNTTRQRMTEANVQSLIDAIKKAK